MALILGGNNEIHRLLQRLQKVLSLTDSPNEHSALRKATGRHN